MVEIRPLARGELAAEELARVRTLLAAALVHDPIAIVAEEKLFGHNGARSGVALGAFRGAEPLGVMALAGRWLKLLAVAEGARGHGIGSALLRAARDLSGRRLRVADHPGNYLSPGIDERYRTARAFFERRGFQVVAEVENLRAPLDDNPLVTPTRARELTERAAAAGYRIRRATLQDQPGLLDWIARGFAAVWANEVALALAAPKQAVHLALHDGAPVAFAAADGNNRGLGWFGPAGTAPEHRGRGLGEALLIHCLLDVRGLPDAGVIAWVGPKPFYARACAAEVDRRFIVLEEPAS